MDAYFDKGFLRQFLVSFLPMLLALAVAIFFVYRAESIASNEQLAASDRNRLEISERLIQSQLESLENDLLYLVAQDSFQAWLGNPEPTSESGFMNDFRIFLAHYQKYEQLRLIGPDGVELFRIRRVDGTPVRVPDNELQDKSERYYVEEIAALSKGEIYLSAFDLNIENGEIEIPYKPVLRIGAALYDQNDNYLGALVLNYLGASLLEELRGVSEEPGRDILLLNAAGYWLLAPEQELEWGFMFNSGTRFQDNYPGFWEAIQQHQPLLPDIAGVEENFDYLTINTDLYLNQVENHEWVILAHTDASYIDENLFPTLRNSLLIFAFMATMLALISSQTSRREIERNQSTEQLRESEKQYRGLLESAPDSVIIVDSAGVIQIVNGEAERAFGYEKEELLGKPVEMLLPADLKDRHIGHRQDYLKNAVIRPMGQSSELYGQRKDGSNFPVEISLSPLVRGSETLVTAIIRDVTLQQERRNSISDLNRRLRLRTHELEAINAELESFSYSVSHDLRAPLRAIDGFSSTIQREYAERLDERGRDRLARIRAAAGKMGNLIDDLLNLSRVSRTRISRGNMDLEKLCKDLAAELKETDRNRQVEFLIEPGLEINADARLMQIVMQNLMVNAFKFTSKKEQAIITISKTVEEQQTVYSIQDNGAGFSMAYADKLFGAFQRLHDQNEFPGSGIGLATVQRIVHKHGGRIWATAEPEQGATFFFTVYGDDCG